MMKDPKDELLVQMARSLELLLCEAVAVNMKSDPQVALNLSKQIGALSGTRDTFERKDQ